MQQLVPATAHCLGDRADAFLGILRLQHPQPAHAPRLWPLDRGIIAAMFFRIGGSKSRLASAAQPTYHNDRMAFQLFPDGTQRIVAAHEVRRHANRNVRNRKSLARERMLVAAPCYTDG
jgi:hypothetical protein